MRLSIPNTKWYQICFGRKSQIPILHNSTYTGGRAFQTLWSVFFGCGTVYICLNSSRCDYIVQDLDSVWIKILPHFDLYSLQTSKKRITWTSRRLCLLSNPVYILLKKVLPNLRLLKREWITSDLSKPVLRPIFDTALRGLIWCSSNLGYDKVAMPY